MDGNDPLWQQERSRFAPSDAEDAAVIRYRDWNLLRYWFRGVERFAPWVRTIHLVTWGSVPSWLNTAHPKLRIVTHESYLPKTACPTFNSNAIELSMHCIADLAEQFVYFNDDMFLLRPVEPTFFFRDGLPCDNAVLSPVMPVWGDTISKTILNNMFLINKHFDCRRVMRQHWGKWLRLQYGSGLLRTLCLLPWRHFPGFFNDHLPVASRKQTFEQLWQAEGPVLQEVTHHRFRCYSGDVNHWLMRYWQLCQGRFCPVGNRGKDLHIEAEETLQAIRAQRYAMICINDSNTIGLEFEQVRGKVAAAFESVLRLPCLYEKD